LAANGGIISSPRIAFSAAFALNSAGNRIRFFPAWGPSCILGGRGSSIRPGSGKHRSGIIRDRPQENKISLNRHDNVVI